VPRETREARDHLRWLALLDGAMELTLEALAGQEAAHG
jgi:hypothetical protein